LCGERLKKALALVEVIYLDRRGNHLFQYCLGRIIAERLGLALQAAPIPGFPGTAEVVQGRKQLSPEQVLQGHRIDLAAILEDPSPRRIVLKGWFQRYAYFQPYAAVIRHWLQRPLAMVDRPNPRDLVVHVRRHDYLWHGWALPFSWYEQLIEQRSFRQLILVTDDPADPFFWRFRRYHPILRSQSADADFDYLLSARQLALSPSSFAWWAAFLGQAEWIGFPVPYDGLWAATNPEGVDLRVWDDLRHTLLPSHEPMRLNFAERLYFERLFYRRKPYYARLRKLKAWVSQSSVRSY
jgi:hypothetical protein